ncbi:transcription factor bHLH128-like [Apium graveolens]|uniref:transcription factor bHLH128-like n=1 Tax=Apium graveolens TaxID=4045 RepID=UPI003D7B0174
MYPPSSSSSSQGQGQGQGQGQSNLRHNNSGGLNRYDSAPGSFLAAVDSVIGQARSKQQLSPLAYFSSSSSEAAAAAASGITTTTTTTAPPDHNLSMNGLQGSYASSSSPSSNSAPLIRHSSLPAGFLNRVPSADNGFSVSRGVGGYNSHGAPDNASGIQRLNSQLSFTRQDSLSQITEESENAEHDIHAEGRRKATHSFATASFGMGSWDNSSNITFSGGRGKRAKNDNGGCLNITESQFQFGLSEMALDMASMEHMMEIPQDSVPCKARAKRGCATHPRSIAERERRTRISGKLKKLQDLVPNMDKQTSYADMLDLAVQHIKGLQTQVQKLNTDLEHCTCGCKQNTPCNQ